MLSPSPLSARTHAALPPLDELRFIYVTGKGGVGKTTVSAALARAMAARGRRVLVCMCNSKDRLSKMLGSAPIGSEVVHVAPNIDAVNMVPEKCLEEYGVLILKVRSLYKALFENRYVETFFRAVPGLFEWSMLGKAWWHTTELLSGGTTDETFPPPGDGWKYETVILDAPATGHGLDMLRVPRVILDVVPPGILRRDAERAWRLFQEPHTSGVVVVTLPEEMPASETIELVSAVRAMNLPIPRLAVNGVMPRLFDPAMRAALLGHAAGSDLSPARSRASRAEIQEHAFQRLAPLGIPTVLLPFLFDRDTSEPDAILQLAKLL